jgi:tRNA-N(6)-(isopentenyl)adenosine-37 thiotransferase enzyme MiaB
MMSLRQSRFNVYRLYQLRRLSNISAAEDAHKVDIVAKEGKGKTCRGIPKDGITLSHFIASSVKHKHHENEITESNDVEFPLPVSLLESHHENKQCSTTLRKIKFHLRTYGCQMNVSDSDIVRSILLNSSFTMEETEDELEADVLLTNTCAIRENAESKIWHRLRSLRSYDTKYPKRFSDGSKRRRIIGVLGCMAERLKEEMFREGNADLVVGPDAYRDLPRILRDLTSITSLQQTASLDYEKAINVQLSFDETYADVIPIRSNPNDISAFVSVMRGCNNMCSYCVVPFTRGRERSRQLTSIVEEVNRLYTENNIKEVVLLGQNVNSYHDRSQEALAINPEARYETSNDGFTNLFRLRGGGGFYFADLVAATSDISPELRVRFTSPHPKDYPKELLQLMAERHNVCKQLHMPAQSGSTEVLKRMRRGYTREAYMELIDTVRSTIPDVSLSSDFISGFCGETDEEHRDTISLMKSIQFDQAFMFAYSMREKTHAHRQMVDDVPQEVKLARLNEVITTFREEVQAKNDRNEVGRLRVVLVEGESKKSEDQLNGRTDQNKRILFPNHPCLSGIPSDGNSIEKVWLKSGDYAVVKVLEARGHTLRGQALWRTTLKNLAESHCLGSKEQETDILQHIGKHFISSELNLILDAYKFS